MKPPNDVSMTLEGPYFHEENQEDYWVWKIYVFSTGQADYGSEWTMAQCIESLEYKTGIWVGKSLAGLCECGSRDLYKPFAPGHAHWCAVSPQNIKSPVPRP